MSTAAPSALPALGTCLEEYEYPYPVGFLPLISDLQPVSMAYGIFRRAPIRMGRRSC
jgi:hypothetical protein